MNQIRGVYIFTEDEDFASIDYNDLKKRGCTDIFLIDHNLLKDYDQCVIDVNVAFYGMKDTGLKLHLTPPPFQNADETQADPANSVYMTTMRNAIIQILNDTELSGISFDDYVYPSDYNTATNQITKLCTFADSIRTAIKAVDLNLLFSVAFSVMPPEDMGTILTHLDFGIPENYVDINKDLGWLKNNINLQIMNTNTPLKLVCGLSTYMADSDLRYKDKRDLYDEIDFVLSKPIGGYILFRNQFLDPSILFLTTLFSEPLLQLQVNLSLYNVNNPIPERSSRWFNITVLNEDGSIPSEALISHITGQYKITDDSTGTEILPFTDFSMNSNSIDILLTNNENKMVTDSVREEQHRITVSITYGEGLEENRDLVFSVQNLVGITS